MIYVIGIGPGHPDYLLPAAVEAAKSCQVLVGGKRALTLFQDGNWERFQVTGDLEALRQFMRVKLANQSDIGVLVSGDPGYYSLLPYIKRNFPSAEIKVIPGISSLQVAFSRAGIPWQDAQLGSAHGRSLTEMEINPEGVLGLLTGSGENSPQGIAANLLKQGPNRSVLLGNNLAYPDEVWLETDLAQLAGDSAVYSNAVMLVLPKRGM